MNLLALKHCLFKNDDIDEPQNGINLLKNLNVRHFERWGHNLDYHIKSKTILKNNKLVLTASKDKTVYFNWDKWDWLYEPKEGYDQVYNYSSGRCDTKDKVTLDLYKAGKIISKHTTPQDVGVVLSIWIYFEEHPKDKHKPKRDMYFEIDTFETEPALRSHPLGLIFTSYLGTKSANAKRKTTWLKSSINGTHVTELSWDGNGRFVWKLDGVVVKRDKMKLPEGIKPYVIYSLGINEEMRYVEGQVLWSKYIVDENK